MKGLSAQSLKSRSQTFGKSQEESSAYGHLFLGHKLLDELRILIRLSSSSNGNDYAGLKESAEQSY